VVQAEGTSRQIYEFGPGRFFGEMAIVEHAPRSASCLAVADCELLVLGDGDFYRLVFEHPQIGLKVLGGIGRTMVSWLDESSRFLNDLVRWGEVARRRVVEDPFTGLFNRRFLEESLASRFSALAAGSHPFCLMMMDLDHFRQINARFGSPGGDRTIQAVARALQPALRGSDIAAHLAGDEFAFLLPEAGLDEALAVGERICRRVEAMVLELAPLDGRAPCRVAVTASLGVAAAPGQGDSPERLLAAADAALYLAKAGGRNRVAAVS
jgi:diguanylate cyclase (GGDEF)-like protein